MYKKYSEGFILSDIVSASSNSDTGIFTIVSKSLKFIFVSYIISIILLALLALIIVYTDVSEQIAGPSVKGITLFGAFLAAFLASKTTRVKGWLCGIFTGTLNIALLKLFGAALMGASLFETSNFIVLGGGALFGMIGGIIGVNFGDN